MRHTLRVATLLAIFGATGVAQTSYADRNLTVNGLRIHYLDWGSPAKPPLVLLHGIGRTAHSFDHIAPHFTPSFQVIAVDLRGHGDSEWHPNAEYLVDDYVKDLEGLAEQLNLRQITLLGNSTGGRVAQVYAARHPERVIRLIVEDVGPERPQDVAAGFARRVQQDANGWSSEDELVAQLEKESPGLAETLVRSHAHYATRRRDDGRIVWKRDPNLVKGFVPTELWQDVRRIACPTIYILGSRSTIVPPETKQRLKQAIQGVEIVTMPGVGHYPHLEAPEQYLAIVDRFLSKTRQSAAR